MHMIENVPLSDLMFLPELQARAGGIDTDHVADMLATLAAGKPLLPPPGSPTSFRAYRLADGRLVVTDGWHSGEAHKRHGTETVEVEIIDGTMEEAIWDASGRNPHHGLKRSNEDKERAVALALHARPKSSNNAIALHCGVSDTLVTRVRETLELAGAIPETSVRVGADGRERAVPSQLQEKEVGLQITQIAQPEPVSELPGGEDNDGGAGDEYTAGGEGATTLDNLQSEGTGSGVEPVNSAAFPARPASLPAHFKPGNHVDPDHPHAELLKAIVSLATKLSKACNDAEPGDKIRTYLANVGFVLPRAAIVNDKTLGWKCIGLRGLYRVVRLAGLDKKTKTKEQVRAEFARVDDGEAA